MLPGIIGPVWVHLSGSYFDREDRGLAQRPNLQIRRIQRTEYTAVAIREFVVEFAGNLPPPGSDTLFHLIPKSPDSPPERCVAHAD